MRGGSASDGVRVFASMTFMVHDAPQFRQAGSAFGAGAQRKSDLGDVGCLARGQRFMDRGKADAEAGADHGTGFGDAGAADHLAQIAPLRRRVRRSDEQRAFEPAIDEGRGAIEAVLAIDVFASAPPAETDRARVRAMPSARRSSQTGCRRRQPARRAPTRCRPAARAARGRAQSRDRRRRPARRRPASPWLRAGRRTDRSAATPDRRRAPTTHWHRSSGSARRSSRAAGRPRSRP